MIEAEKLPVRAFLLEDEEERVQWFAGQIADLTVTADVEEAIRILESSSFDIIFMDRDLSHPEQTGEDVAWEMKERGLAPGTPVIVHSVNTRGQRVIARYLREGRQVEVIPFNELRRKSLSEVLGT